MLKSTRNDLRLLWLLYKTTNRAQLPNMGGRRFTHVSSTDEEDDAPLNHRRRKRIEHRDEEEEEEEEQQQRENGDELQRIITEEESEEEKEENATPFGEVIRFSDEGNERRSHYEALEFYGIRYDLEDAVLLVPQGDGQRHKKPYVAIIKDITQTEDGVVILTAQWLYRPEEAKRKGGGNWECQDARELFYSFHRDEVCAEAIMHKCVVHFIPLHKQLPDRKKHPGFIVQKVYDTEEQKLWKLTDKDYEDDKQREIDLLVEKTLARLGGLPDIVTNEIAADPVDQLKEKRTGRKRNISREEEVTKPGKVTETPGRCTSNSSKYYNILFKFNALTGDTLRDKWLERLLVTVQYMCNIPDSIREYYEDKAKHGSDSHTTDAQGRSKDVESFWWPDAAVHPVSALERAAHGSLSSDFQKYNQKMRQLQFNLKNNAVLARRLLNGELEPSTVLNMSPDELKEGLTAEEMAKKEPDESECMQMTDARCSRCSEFKVGVRSIIQAGNRIRYQLECITCGNSWYASRDTVSMITMDGPDSAKNVGTASQATAKFE